MGVGWVLSFGCQVGYLLGPGSEIAHISTKTFAPAPVLAKSPDDSMIKTPRKYQIAINRSKTRGIEKNGQE